MRKKADLSPGHIALGSIHSFPVRTNPNTIKLLFGRNNLIVSLIFRKCSENVITV